MSTTGPVEIGWKRELLNESKSASDCKNRSSRKTKKKSYHRLSSGSDSSLGNRSRSPSTSSSSSSSSSPSDNKHSNQNRKEKEKERKEKRKEKKRLKKEKLALEKAQRREIKKAKKEKIKEEKRLKKLEKKNKAKNVEMNKVEGADYSIPIDLMYVKSKAPESKEEYERRQSQIRREIDPETGRTRLIKGDGEILEEIVSRDRHREINKRSTRGDGEFFQMKTVGWNLNSGK